MKRCALLISAFVAVPLTGARADNCCFTIGSATAWSCSPGYIERDGRCAAKNAPEDAPTLTLTRHWVLTAPGAYTLEETSFRVSFWNTDITYHLYFGSKDLGSFKSSSAAQQEGINRARDMVKAGVSLIEEKK